MPGQDYYNPQTQEPPAPEEEKLPEIENYLAVYEPGMYLLTEDVSMWLARFAERFRGEGRLALLQAAQAFAPTEPEADVEKSPVEQSEAPTALSEPDAPPSLPRVADVAASASGSPSAGLEGTYAPQTTLATPPVTVDVETFETRPLDAPSGASLRVTAVSVVARVEVYPNEDGSYWYARPVDAMGRRIAEPVGQISHDGVLGDADRMWPGVAIYELPDGLADSIDQETHPATTWNGRPRPSSRRLFGK